METAYLRALILPLITVVVLWVPGCVTAPETNRQQFILTDPQYEMKLGFQSFQELRKQTPVSQNSAAAELVRRVGQRISAVANLPGAQWEFVLFESKEPNAFCLPGGKVGVYTGILPITKDEAGLAAVIGHEVAHAVLRHGGERMSTAMAIQGVGSIAAATIGMSASDPRAMQAFQSLYGIGSQVGVALPHSRKQESEADRVGLRYMARAGYNPEAAVEFWQRFAAYSAQRGGSPPELLRTHPTDATRIRQIQEWLPEAQAQFRAQ